MTVPVMMIVALVVGLAIGALAGSKWSPAVAQAKLLREELERLRKEHDGYRASVNAHFRKTADLVGQMTKSYAAVYDHLAGGARRFCDDEAGDGQLAFSPLPGSLAAPDIEADAGPSTEAAAPASPADEAAASEPAAQDEDTVPQAFADEAQAPSGFDDFAVEEDAPVPDADTEDPAKNA